MSAIFGIHNLDGKPVSQSVLEKMSGLLSHRGNDGTGIWRNGSVGFGHRMLWTTVESLDERLPLAFEQDELVITADARIDNREDLLSRIGTFGKPEASVGDSEIILAAYRKWGKNCTSKLLGDFAFVIWDKAEQSLFCGRDHLGVKSLNYYYSDKLFVFASEIKAILCVEEVPHILNEVKIGDYLTATSDDLVNTFYKDICKIPPGHQMTVNRNGKFVEAYWNLDPERETNYSSDKEYAENFREIFTEAVRCRMRSAFPLGSMLSGGLDSSSIACTARKIMLEGGSENRNSDIHTFSAVFEKVEKSDESFYINAVLKQGNFTPHYLKADQISPLSDLEKMIWHLDGAIQPGNLYINWNLYKTAQENKVRVMLDGFDGDSTVSHGKVYLLELAQAKKWFAFLREAKGYAKNFDESASSLIWAYYWKYSLESRLSKYDALRPLRRYGKKMYKRTLTKDTRPPFTDSEIKDGLNPDFVERINLNAYLKSVKAVAPKTEREEHFARISQGAIPYILETLDKSSAPFGIEVRYPFFDKRLVEYCLSLPARQKMRNGYTRMVMRRAMEGILPKDVQWRPGKSNLSYGFNEGLRGFEYARINNILKSSVSLLKNYTNVKSLFEIHERFSNGSASDMDILKISSSISLALWLQTTKFTK